MRLRLLGVGLRVPYDAPGWDGCKWDPFGTTTLVDREKRVVVVCHSGGVGGVSGRREGLPLVLGNGAWA